MSDSLRDVIRSALANPPAPGDVLAGPAFFDGTMFRAVAVGDGVSDPRTERWDEDSESWVPDSTYDITEIAKG